MFQQLKKYFSALAIHHIDLSQASKYNNNMNTILWDGSQNNDLFEFGAATYKLGLG